MHGLENVKLSDFIIVIIIIIIENVLSLALFSKKWIDDSLSNYRPISIINTSSKIPEFVINEHFPHHLKYKLNTWQHGSIKYKSTATSRVKYPDFITPLFYCQWLVVAFIFTSAEQVTWKEKNVYLQLPTCAFVTCCILSRFSKCQYERLSKTILIMCMIQVKTSKVSLVRQSSSDCLFL
jgi:hypothetical protein